jgi:hypothetical protein
MKATIDSAGKLTVTPETELEAYALRKWATEGPDGGTGVFYPDYRNFLPAPPKESKP